MKDLYRILNVDRNASDEDIKKSYRLLVKRYHPDATRGDKVAAQRRFEEISDAYSVLSDVRSRAEYDAELAAVRLFGNTEPIPDTFVTADPVLAANVQSILAHGYKSGYIDGALVNNSRQQGSAGDASKLLGDIEKLKAELKKSYTETAALKRDLAERERNIEQLEECVDVLDGKLEWLRQVGISDYHDNVIANKNKAATAEASRLRADIETCATQDMPEETVTTVAQQVRRKQIRERLVQIEAELGNFAAELSEIDSVEAQKRLLEESEETMESLKAHAEAWAKKARHDRKLAKPTLYGLLGVLIWALPQEIDDAYERLTKRYEGDDGDPEKLKQVKQAYLTLVNPSLRAKYDLSIGYTQDMIDSERKLIAENAKLQAEYKKKLEQRTFWDKFDSLSSLALSGDAEAQNALGEMYYMGTNIPRDYKHAVYWFGEAFEQSHPCATYNLGICYYNGHGVERNVDMARSIFRQAKNLGYKPGSNGLHIEV